MASSLQSDRPHYLISVQNIRIMGGGEGIRDLEELLASDEFYLIVNALLRPIAVARKLPADDLEDVLQEVCLAIVAQRCQNKEPVQRWRRWLRQVIRNKVVDALRYLSSGIVSLDALAAEPVSPESQEADGARERRMWLAKRLEEMAEEDALNARLVRRHFLQGRSYTELAAAEGLTEKAVERRISRTINQLRQRAAKEGLLKLSQKDQVPGKKLREK